MRCVEIENMFVDAFLDQRRSGRRDNSRTRISGAGDPLCKLWFRRTGAYAVPSTAHQMYTFATGHVLHEQFQKLAHRMGLGYCEPVVEKDGSVSFRGLAEVQVSDPETQAMGHFDLLTAALGRVAGTLTLGAGTNHFLLDFKTISDQPKVSYEKRARSPFTGPDGTLQSHYWKRLRPARQNGSDPDWTVVPDGSTLETRCPVRYEPGAWTALRAMKDEHRLQASMYAYVINRYGLPLSCWPEHWTHAEVKDGRVWPTVSGILLVYLAKDHGPQDYPDPFDERNLPIKVFAEPLDAAVIEGLKEKFQALNLYVATNERPPQEPWPGGMAYPCAYCEYRHACRPESFAKDGRPR